MEIQGHFEEENRKSEEHYQQKAKETKIQLDSHVDSIQILVSEKRELESSINELNKNFDECKGIRLLNIRVYKPKLRWIKGLFRKFHIFQNWKLIITVKLNRKTK